MTDRKLIDEKAKIFFEELWSQDDFWALETSAFEKKRYETLLSMINDRHNKNALEIGCGTGTFTRLLSNIVEDIVALDISSTAIDRARNYNTGNGKIDYRVANIMELDLRNERK